MLTVSGNSIDFGVTTAEFSMHIMQTIDDNVRVTLKVGDYKEIEIQLPITIDGARHSSRFKLPLALIESIYRVENSLVIPFKSVCTLASRDILAHLAIEILILNATRAHPYVF